ncbi:Chromosome partitioning ATPase, Mrp family, contains Fe-S cluster [Neorhodopirellula lusitana]|uniref:Chromosome partitioning ATPase, Mrp family, contains Fe-S cluster n=1 Tax=Neorhodopirellula lusitana TaxID=445327 RepID=A0ABY1PT48_9BACT|nr:hypothetical protein [Neorhodopirellula lusitana]SMP44205.1 Chromosome partitioning ATPase, Mrp family, contains Fe-S cluster [Neorhodopirellula lusitana]
MPRTGLSQTTNADAVTSINYETPTKQSRPLSGLPEFSELVIACRHRLWQTLSAGCIVSVALMALAWWLTAATYYSESYVRVRQREDVVLSAQTSRSEDLAYFRTQSQLALSPQVLAAALLDKELQSVCSVPSSTEGVTWLSNLMRAEAQIGAEILSISASHQSAAVSHAASLAVTRAYLDEVISREKADRDRRRVELENAARIAEQDLTKQWAQLNEVASELGSSDTQSLSMRDQIRMQAYRDYAQQLRAAQLRRVELQSILSEEQTRVSKIQQQQPSSTPKGHVRTPEPPAPLVTKPQFVTTPQITNLQHRIAELDFRISEIQRIAAQPDPPRLNPLHEQRQHYVAQLNELIASQENDESRRSNAQPDIDAFVEQTNQQDSSTNQNATEPVNQLAQIQKKIELNESESQFLKDRMAEIDSTSARKQNRNGVDLEVARHSVERQSRLADQLWKSLEELKIESQSQPRVALMHLADFPLHPNQSRRIKATAGAFGIGWLLVILSIGLFEYQSCLIRDSDVVTSISTHPVFGINSETESGQVPKSRFQSGTKQCISSAAARETAARLMLLDPNERQIPTVLVTGPTNEEPHEQAALRIALAFAGYKRRTLLINSDVTSERLESLLGTQSQPGLTQLDETLNESIDNAQALPHVIPTSHPCLDFLPNGIAASTDTWIDPQTLLTTLRSVRSQYDAIVIAGPALCASGESLLVAAQADLIVLSAIVGRTRLSDLATCHEKVEATNLEIAGTVLLPKSFGKRVDSLDIPQLHIGTPATVRGPVSTPNHHPNHTTAASSAEETEMQKDIAALQDELQHAVASNNSSRSASVPKPQSDSIS